MKSDPDPHALLTELVERVSMTRVVDGWRCPVCARTHPRLAAMVDHDANCALDRAKRYLRQRLPRHRRGARLAVVPDLCTLH